MEASESYREGTCVFLYRCPASCGWIGQGAGASVMDALTPLTPLTILAVEDNPADIYTVQWVLTAHVLAYNLQVVENANQAFSVTL